MERGRDCGVAGENLSGESSGADAGAERLEVSETRAETFVVALGSELRTRADVLLESTYELNCAANLDGDFRRG